SSLFWLFKLRKYPCRRSISPNFCLCTKSESCRAESRLCRVAPRLQAALRARLPEPRAIRGSPRPAEGQNRRVILSSSRGALQKPVKIIVPFAPGGNSDGIARLIAQPLGEAFGQQFVVENRAAAVGAVAAEAVARSSADGHMLLMGSPSQIAILPVTTKTAHDRSKILLPSASLGPIRTFWSSIPAYRRIRLLNSSTMPVAAPT